MYMRNRFNEHCVRISGLYLKCSPPNLHSLSFFSPPLSNADSSLSADAVHRTGLASTTGPTA